MFQMPGGRRQSRFAVVGGYSGDSCGGGVGVFANQKQWPRGIVRRGEKDLVELVAGIFHGGGVSVEMGKCTRVVVYVVVVFGLLALGVVVGPCRRLRWLLYVDSRVFVVRWL